MANKDQNPYEPGTKESIQWANTIGRQQARENTDVRKPNLMRKAFGVSGVIVASLIALEAVPNSRGLWVIALAWIIPGIIAGNNRGRPWYNSWNWMLWLGPLGLIAVFSPYTSPEEDKFAGTGLAR